MFYRIFIAIELPDSTRKELCAFNEIWSELPVRWTGEQNLHVTLEFLGNVNEETLKEVIDRVSKIGERNSKVEIHIEKIAYGPPKEIPRYIWAYITPSDNLMNLSRELNLTEFIPHITLARIDKMEFNRMETPIINEYIDIVFPVSAISIMESKKGSDYTALKRIELK